MDQPLRVFVSSVQKELNDERLVVQNLMNTDEFISKNCAPVLYEYEPASPAQGRQGCLDALDCCQVYVLIVGIKYGSVTNGLSITHEEYRRAKELKLPVLVFIKGERSVQREEETQHLLDEIDDDGFKYKRFSDVIELQTEVRAALVQVLHERFGVFPSRSENSAAKRTIEATSAFESTPTDRLRWEDLDLEIVRKLVSSAEEIPLEELSDSTLLQNARARGLVWYDRESDEFFCTAAGVVFAAPDPSAVFPQCRILADAFRGFEPDDESTDNEVIRSAMPLAIERAIAFVKRNTRHPIRIVGMHRVQLDEYPVEGLREALVNAVAHRQYEHAGLKIIIQVFADRVAIASPGLPPSPISLEQLRRGRYKPCSRNPVLAQCLSFFHKIEERGSGFRRMKEQMLNHGLNPPILDEEGGFFQVTFLGPGDDIGRLRVPEELIRIEPAVEANLNDRQRAIMENTLQIGSVTTGWCIKEFSVSRDTAHRDLTGLVEVRLLERTGSGRGTKYVLSGVRLE